MVSTRVDDRKSGPGGGGMIDAERVARALDGDRSAYEELVREWAPRVRAFCIHRIRRRDIAEDVTQEAFIRGYRSLDRLREPEKFGAWIRGIAELACRDWLRSRAASEVPLSTVHDHAGDHFERPDEPFVEAIEHADDLRYLVEAVSALPPDYRETIALYYTSDFTYDELGQFLGVSGATVNARLTKGRALLRRRLADLDPSAGGTNPS
ncbi:MAG: RNA polymerase sigma factor [Planctomycetota bacterium]